MPRTFGLTLALLVLPTLVASVPADGYGETCAEIAGKVSAETFHTPGTSRLAPALNGCSFGTEYSPLRFPSL